MQKNYDKCLETILHHEGGYVNHPKDPGGETNFGISKRSYPDLDIANLTVEDAVNIYKRDYWDKVKCDSLPTTLAFCLFDFSVNSGHKRAVSHLQSVVSEKIDGIIGPKTLAAACNAYEEDPLAVINAYQDSRLKFLKRLRTWDTFGKGWARRVEEVRKTALANTVVKLKEQIEGEANG